MAIITRREYHCHLIEINPTRLFVRIGYEIIQATSWRHPPRWQSSIQPWTSHHLLAQGRNLRLTQRRHKNGSLKLNPNANSWSVSSFSHDFWSKVQNFKRMGWVWLSKLTKVWIGVPACLHHRSRQRHWSEDLILLWCIPTWLWVLLNTSKRMRIIK